MSRIESFDDFLTTEYETLENETPFQFRDNQSSEEDTLLWLNNNFNTLERRAQSRLDTYRRYWAMYKGIMWRNKQERRYNHDDQGQNTRNRKPQMVTNFVHEMVEGRVSQVAQSKISISAIPHNDEASDVSNAKACKLLLDARADQMDMDEIQADADRIKYITGTVFQFVRWDREAGPLAPQYDKLSQKGIDPIDPKSKKALTDIRIGDVEVENIDPSRLFPEADREFWKDVNHIDIIEWVHVEELRREYPKKKDLILENSGRFRYDTEALEVSRPQYMVMVRHFWHKKTKYLPKGVYIKYTDDVILEWTAHPYDHGNLPIIVDFDIKIHKELFGRSFISNIEQKCRMYNNIESGMARDIAVGMTPKWMVPKGSTQINSLNNDFVVVEYTGPQAPRIEQNAPVSQGILTVLDRTEKRIAQDSTLYDISRGEVPQGVTANSALRFLDEQESRRSAPLIARRRRRIREVFRSMAVLMAQFYHQDDGRLVRILGKRNDFRIKAFKQADFTQIYDIRIQNQSALPDTKTGKISTIVDLNMSSQTDPIFNKKEIIELMDLGMDEAYVDRATAASETARATWDELIEGEMVPEPQLYDDLMVYYSVFTTNMQAMYFRSKVSKEVRQVVEDYLLVLEGLMFEKAKRNAKFCQELTQISVYPIFYTPSMPLMQLMQMHMGGNTNQQPQAAQPKVDTSKMESLPTQSGEPNDFTNTDV